MDTHPTPSTPVSPSDTPAESADSGAETPKKPRLEPTRYGDWELNGKCVDF